MRLHTIFVSVLVVFIAVVVPLVVILMTTTTWLHEAVVTLEASMESVRTAQAIELHLLLHDRLEPGWPAASDESNLPEQALQEARVRHELDVAMRFAESPEEAEAVDRLRSRVDRYLGERRRPQTRPPTSEGVGRGGRRPLDAVIDSARALIDINVEKRLAARERATTMDRNANAVGVAALVLLGAGVTLAGLWLRMSLVRPLRELTARVVAFGEGRFEERLPESGPAELRSLARIFNTMAETLARQRQERLAFLAGLAHDLRNPLAPIKLSLALVRRRGPASTREEHERSLMLFEGQITRLDRMVGDLLDAATAEAGAIPLELGGHDLRDIAHEVVALQRPAAGAREIAVDVPEIPVVAIVDRQRTLRVLENLLNNAIKYTPEGGKIRVVVRQEGAEALVSVSDDGIGIAEVDQRRLFEPFHRAPATRGVFHGTGLGLATSRRLVEAHGGRIEVESAVGVGSTFRVRLPCRASEDGP